MYLRNSLIRPVHRDRKFARFTFPRNYLQNLKSNSYLNLYICCLPKQLHHFIITTDATFFFLNVYPESDGKGSQYLIQI